MKKVYSNHFNLVDIVSLKKREDFILELTFSDGKRGLFDLKKMPSSLLKEKVLTEEVYAQAHVERGVLIFNEKADIAPEYLYENVV